MKKILVLPILFIALLTNTVSAKIWRVNNTAGVNADFTDPQLAHNAAVAGDTIHIEPSATGYGNLNVSKRIVLIGNGHTLNQDTGLQVNSNNSTISSLDFQVGSANSSMQGMSVTYLYLEDQNVMIRRNSISYIYWYPGAINNTLLDNSLYYIIQNQAGAITGINISNNIFNGINAVSFNSTSSGIFENNVCYGGGAVTLYNFQVDNNIFWSTSFPVNNNVYFNNIGDGTQFGNANGNQQNVTPMANYVFVASGTYDGQFQLKTGSPAIGAGFNGVDCGAFGGPNPYKLGGIPNVPTIYKLVVPPTGTTNINVTISTKSNN
jgi:hypothetical protein